MRMYHTRPSTKGNMPARRDELGSENKQPQPSESFAPFFEHCKGKSNTELEAMIECTHPKDHTCSMCASRGEQEWTWVIAKLRKWGAPEQYVEAVIAMDAALSAEQQKRADWNVVIEDLEAALESKEAELQAFLTDADSARESWMQQLADEREKLKLLVDVLENYQGGLAPIVRDALAKV